MRTITRVLSLSARSAPVIGMFGLPLALYAAPPKAAVGGRYTDGPHHFSLVPPVGWTVNKDLVPHYAVFVEPSKSAQDEAATIGTYGEPLKNMTLEQYVQAAKKGMGQQKGLSLYDEQTLTLGGLKAYSWRAHVRVPGWPAHENRQVFGVRGSQAVILTLTALPAEIKKYDAAFDAALASFRWEGGAASSTEKAGKNDGSAPHGKPRAAK